MARGGSRQGAGRKKGSTGKRTALARQVADQALISGEAPLDYMLRVMRDETAPSARRDAMAVAAAAYVHPRLAAVEHSGEMTLNHEQALEELERKADAANEPAMRH